MLSSIGAFVFEGHSRPPSFTKLMLYLRPGFRGLGFTGLGFWGSGVLGFRG